jgi:two-component system, sensor histidine kinase and response regulator
MPGMSGFQLAGEIGKTPNLSGLPMIMLTSVGQRDNAARCRQLGLACSLTKPVGQTELMDTILGVMGLKTVPAKVASTPQHLSSGNGGSGGNGRSLRILLAEDNPVNQRPASRMLEKHGHRVVLAGNGREALERLEEESCDVIVMDVQMPEIDGFEATAAIRKKEEATGAHIPIVAMTAHAMQGDKQNCLAAGMDGYVSKPINIQELLAVVQSVMASSKVSSEDRMPVSR